MRTLWNCTKVLVLHEVADVFSMLVSVQSLTVKEPTHVANWCSGYYSLPAEHKFEFVCVSVFCSRHSSAEIRRNFSGNYGFQHSRTNSNASATGYLAVVSPLLFFVIFIQQVFVTLFRRCISVLFTGASI